MAAARTVGKQADEMDHPATGLGASDVCCHASPARSRRKRCSATNRTLAIDLARTDGVVARPQVPHMSSSDGMPTAVPCARGAMFE